MIQGAETLRSRLYRLQNQEGEQVWVQRGQGYPQFKRQDVSHNQSRIFFDQDFTVLPVDKFFMMLQSTPTFNFNVPEGIQWTQVRQNEVMALSFKQQFSANAFWQLIEQYQRKFAISVPAANGKKIIIQVPDPTTDNLHLVLQELQNIPQIQRHERVASIFLTKRDLLPRLLGVFKRLEQNKGEIQKLQNLFQIMKIIFNASNQLEYIRDSVMFPYLNDNGFGSSGCIIRANYKKIITQLFNNKKRDFLNSLFDLLRLFQVPAFKLLREIFRIARIHYMPEIYQYVADRDTFQIFIKAIKQYLAVPNNQDNKKKKRIPEDLQQIIQVILQILEQYTQHEPHHLKNYLSSQGQKVAKYPTFQMLLKIMYNSSFSKKLAFILKSSLLSNEGNDLKNAFTARIIQEFLNIKQFSNSASDSQALLSAVLLPINQPSKNYSVSLLSKLSQFLGKGSKSQQIQTTSLFKLLIENYFDNKQTIQQHLVPKANIFSQQLIKNRGNQGIRVSSILSILSKQIYHVVAQATILQLKNMKQYNLLTDKYVKMLELISNHKKIELPKALKRDISQNYLEEQNFQSLSKKIKID